MLLIFSHQLTEEQKQQAEALWKVTEYVSLPSDLQARWSNIPPEGNWSVAWVQPIQAWVQVSARPQDSVVSAGRVRCDLCDGAVASGEWLSRLLRDNEKSGQGTSCS